MENVIRFNTYEYKPAYFETPVKTVRSELTRVQRWFVWLADRLGVFKADYERTVKYETTTLDLREIVSGVMEHQHNLMALNSGRAKYLIVGRDQYRGMMMSQEARNLGLFPMPIGGTPPSFAGLEVVVVPYIDGAFILPDLDQR